MKEIESGGGKGRDEEQDGMSVHSPCKAPPSSASSLPKVSIPFSLSLSLTLSKHCFVFLVIEWWIF